jgi:hypothetical protein
MREKIRTIPDSADPIETKRMERLVPSRVGKRAIGPHMERASYL